MNKFLDLGTAKVICNEAIERGDTYIHIYPQFLLDLIELYYKNIKPDNLGKVIPTYELYHKDTNMNDSEKKNELCINCLKNSILDNDSFCIRCQNHIENIVETLYIEEFDRQKFRKIYREWKKNGTRTIKES